MDREELLATEPKPPQYPLQTPIDPIELQAVNPVKPPRLRKDGQIDRRAFTSRRNGLAAGAGSTPKPITNKEAAIDAAVEYIETGHAPVTLAAHSGLTEGQAKAVVSLVNMAPEEFHARLATRLENVLEKLMADMERDTDKISPRDRMLHTAIGIDKLLALRGSKSPSTVHNTQININGMDRTAALALLTGKKAPIPPSPANGHEKTPTD